MPSAKKATLITQTTDMEIPYHSVKTTIRRILKMMSTRRLAIRTQKPEKDSTATHLTGQGVRPLQTFLYLPDMTALRNIYIYHKDLFSHPYRTYCNQQDEVDQHHLLKRTAVQCFIFYIWKPKVLTARQKVEWVTRCQHNPHSNKWYMLITKPVKI